MERVPIPKPWLNAIYIDEGPLAGQTAHPCKCGRPMDFDNDVIHLVKWSNGMVMFVHDGCVEHDEEDDDA